MWRLIVNTISHSNCIHDTFAYLVVDDDVVFGGHVISNVVVHNEPEQPVEEGQINLLVDLLIPRLQHHVTLSLTGVPHVVQVVDAWKGRSW